MSNNDINLIKHTNLNELKDNIVDVIYNKNIKILNKYNTDDLICYSSNEIKIFIINLLEIINNETLNDIKNFKLEYYTPLLNYIFNIVINYNNKKNIVIDIFENNSLFLQKLTNLNKGQEYLKKLKKFILLHKIEESEIFCYMLIACKFGTLMTFLFWYSLSNKKLLLNEYRMLLLNAIINSDDRIYKNLITIKYCNIELNNSDEICIIPLLTVLFESTIPDKFKLKRLKFLSNIINLFNIKYKFIISITSNIKIILVLTKYYYKNNILSFQTINEVVKNISRKNDLLIYYEKFYNLLNTNEEKNTFKLCMSIYRNEYEYESDIIKYIGSYNLIIEENYIPILYCIFNDYLIFNMFNKTIELIFKYYTENNFINKYLNDMVYSDKSILYLKYTRFYVPKNLCYLINIKVNKILHYLRIYIKKFKNNKINNFKKNNNLLLNELINYKPNKKYNILKKGSLNYRYDKVKFNKIPPRHLLPMELYMLSNSLIREKTDGILVNILPNYLFPENNDIYCHEIKAEWIEELNLYLIFDINIPNTTIIERQQFLRNLHSSTYCLNNNLKEIFNIHDLIKCITEERIILNKFINESTDEIKWYPKAVWKINNINDIFYENIINYIQEIDENINNFININNDGLIITPLNGLREIKIKPKSLITIDLLFDGSNWLDNDKTIYYNILNNINLLPNKIYRCYPILSDNKLFFNANEERYEKTKPNKKIIIEQAINGYFYDWNYDLSNKTKFYYHNLKNINDNKLIDMINIQKQYLIKNIQLLNPLLNVNWLDLGCGKCKLFNDISIYKPKNYIGIDADIKYLCNALKIFDKNSDKVKLFPYNLKKKWENNIWFNFDWTLKYHYIIANFSLMHFCNDIFWEQIDKIVIVGSKFIFNLVIQNAKFNYNNSYLYTLNDKTILNFEWIHNDELIEPFINETDLNYYLRKYNWHIISKTINNHNELSKCYNWYIIEKF